MPSHYQDILPVLKEQIHLCLAYRRAKRHKKEGKRLITSDVLNEVIELGLERYSEKYGIPLPQEGK